MNFDQLRYVITLAEEKNFSKAAKRLYITQPTLSQSISSLEQELNTNLFFRTKNTVKPTYSGEEFIKMAKQILLLHANFRNRISDASNEKSGRLSIIATYYINALLCPIIIPAYSETYPNVEIRMIERKHEQQEELLQKGIADFAISLGKMKSPSIQYEQLKEGDPFLLALPPDHRFKKYMDSSVSAIPRLPYGALQELENDRFILPHRGHRYEAVLKEFLEKHDIVPQRTFLSTNIISTVNLVSKGYGITIAPKTIVELAFFYPRPIYFSLDNYGTWIDESLYIAYHKDRPLSSIAQDFCKIAIQVL